MKKIFSLLLFLLFCSYTLAYCAPQTTIKIEAVLKENKLGVSQPGKDPVEVTAHVRIINISKTEKEIGMLPGCCSSQEVQGIISDNADIGVGLSAAGAAALYQAYTLCSCDGRVILKPGEVWEQDCFINYHGSNPSNPKNVSFRLGINTGVVSGWSNPVTVNVVGEKPAWQRFILSLLVKGDPC